MRRLALLLALLLAPQAALARAAAFPESALRADREISASHARAFATQPAEERLEKVYFYGESASAIVDDPINHRDPTGEFIPLAYAIGVGVAVAAGLIFPHELGHTEAEQVSVDAVAALSGALAGPVAGRVASPLLGAVVGGGTAGAVGGLATRGVKDGFAGEISSAGTYAADAAFGLGMGATVGGLFYGASSGMSRVRSALDFEGTFDGALRAALQGAATQQEAAVAASFVHQNYPMVVYSQSFADFQVTAAAHAEARRALADLLRANGRKMIQAAGSIGTARGVESARSGAPGMSEEGIPAALRFRPQTGRCVEANCISRIELGGGSAANGRSATFLVSAHDQSIVPIEACVSCDSYFLRSRGVTDLFGGSPQHRLGDIVSHALRRWGPR